MTTRKNKPKSNSTKNKRKTKCGGGPEDRPKRAAAKSVNYSTKNVPSQDTIEKNMKKKIKQDENEKPFLELANTQVSTMGEIRKLQKKYKTQGYGNYTDKNGNTKDGVEQQWVDENLDIITVWMGTSGVWKCMIPDINDNIGSITFSPNPIIAEDINRGFFSGHHWTSIKKNDTIEFDPYNEYQIHGTNQFCQTYAMMHLLDRLPQKRHLNGISKYYEYTRLAIEFIKEVFIHFDERCGFENLSYRNKVMEGIDNCLINCNACLNVIELPPKNLM